MPVRNDAFSSLEFIGKSKKKSVSLAILDKEKYQANNKNY